MNLPEWRPIPRHIKEGDADTRGFVASLRLVLPVVLIAASVVLFFVVLLLR